MNTAKGKKKSKKSKFAKRRGIKQEEMKKIKRSLKKCWPTNPPSRHQAN